ncbi:MAG: DEAD/DEAH box helicase [Nanoarchaeota archaeon]|nr:DEAD/DEAH box helicase [Nanoarchaeota archaeon]MBU1135616.1 DEAD/DEAH box helicase [Nanoarchaeota archaeon]
MVSEAVQKVLELSGFDSLNPVQKQAVDSGLLEDGNMVIASPTASGKTMIAEFAALDAIKKNKKVIYIVPLKALATEKFNEFKEKYEPLGVKVALSIGDLDSSDPWLANCDLIIVTSEKLDSLMRHGMPWAEMIGLIVIDEIHLLDSPNRGPTLEIVMTRLMQIANPKILGLSATINNYKELASWLNAKAVKSDYRPVDLYTGVCYDGEVSFQPKRELKLKEGTLEELVDDTLSKNKQSLVFVSTRRSAESVAERLGRGLSKKLSTEEKEKLKELSKKILKSVDNPTKQCKRIADCIENGTAFHHAGLISKQRTLIENSFREGLLKVITATPTLSFGLNLPAHRVIIRDLKRFSSFSGMTYLPALEIMQMAGRAGRPKYDTEGEAILLAKNKNEANYAWDNYILGDPENIYSKLGVEPVLRTHVLALISSGITPTKTDLFKFFSKTFYAHQKGGMNDIQLILERVLTSLQQSKFIVIGDGQIEEQEEQSEFKSAAQMVSTNGEELKPSRIGKRVSELYIDPLSANHLIEKLQYAERKGTSAFGILQMISNTIEMKPLLSIRKGDMESINEIAVKEEHNLTDRMPTPWDIEYDDFIRSIKTAAMFSGWIDEAGENKILEAFGVTPGELHARLSNSDWILYASQELALLLALKDVIKDIKKLRIRIKNGIKEELIPLVRLKGIGRTRARILFNFGITSIDKLRKSPSERIAKLIGEKTAKSIKEQLGEEII